MSAYKTTLDSRAIVMKENVSNDKNKPKPKEKPARKRLNYGSSSSSGPTVLSPIESYIAHQKLEIQNQQAKIESLEEDLAEYVARRKLPSTSSLPCCNKCRQKEGHCPYPTACTSALFCGNIDKHPDDKQTVKQKAKQLSDERKSLQAMKEELKNREKLVWLNAILPK